MRNSYPIVFILVLAFLLTSCSPDNCSYDSVSLPEKPRNLAVINSPYDDWNCGIPWEDFIPGMSFLFSSNRNTRGGTFDLTPHNLYIYGEGSLEILGSSGDSLRASAWEGSFMHSAVLTESAVQMRKVAERVGTDEDELGPLFLTDYYGAGAWRGGLVYSQGDTAHHDLRLLAARADPFDFLEDTVWGEGVVDSALTFLNTEADEGYLAYSESAHLILLHSNREGPYRIYQVVLPDSLTVLEWLVGKQDSARITRVDALMASDGEERCPSLHGDTLLFVSDRSGGLGGLDIYRSVWNDSQWSNPVNLGPAVNSSADEYRPVQMVFKEGSSIIYSSDRMGGLGGFDLYLVKMP